MKTLVAASILASDFGRLNDDILSVEKAGVDLLHIDVMDGHFVDNLSFGLPVVECIKSSLPLDVHLMVDDAGRYIEEFYKYAYRIYVHYEAPVYLRGLLMKIVERGVKAGIVLNPETPVDEILDVLDLVDSVMLMAVKPGMGGQKFNEDILLKIEELRARNQGIFIAVDGGINDKTAEMCRNKGANIMVSGSYIFKSEDRVLAVKLLRGE